MKENLEQQINQLKDQNKDLERDLTEMGSYAASYKIQMAEIQTYKDKIYLKCSKKIKEYKRVLQEKTIENIELTAKLQILNKKYKENSASGSKKNTYSTGGQTTSASKGQIATDRPQYKIGTLSDRKVQPKNTPMTSRVNGTYKGLDPYKK